MIEEIKTFVNIQDLASRLGFEVTRSGFIYSIYKNEQTPSLKLYPKTNSYFDFATSQGGDVIKFFADACNHDTKTAVKELAKMYGLEKEKYSNGFKSNKSKPVQRKNFNKQSRVNYVSLLLNNEFELFDERAGIMEFDGGLEREEAERLAFEYILEQRKEVQKKVFQKFYKFSISEGLDERAFDYLLSNMRGLTATSINDFKIFTIKSIKKAIEFFKDSFTRDEIIISGLFSKKYFVFTNHRIVIPYIEKGQIVYLRGRYFDSEGNYKPERWGKYIGLNNFSKTLSPKRFFNVDLLRGLPAFANLIITEGEFDTIISVQEGNNAIGVAGVSNFPVKQKNLLKPFNIFLAFDNDGAGKRATAGVLKELSDYNIKILKLKKFKDITELLTNEKSIK